MILKVKPFSLRTLLPLSSSSSPRLYSLSIFISHFSTSQTHDFHSHHHFSRRSEEASRLAKVLVWWDFENCGPPAGVNVFKIAPMITAALRASGIKGPVQITAFGDIFQLSRTNQEALSSTGVNLSHVPRGGKNSADRWLLVDLMYWISQNPPPAHLFLISGDGDFASILHKLRMNNYNVLLASPESAPSVLCSAASIMWNWNSLLKGDNLTGKHYNQPPDGPYGSWYGHYKVPLEDPFSVEQPACPRTEDLSEGSSDYKIRPVPNAVMKQIRQILNSYPKGISLNGLRAELIHSKVDLDKDYYGYGKFSRFLLSMPQILCLKYEPDGRFLIRGITPKAGDLSETTPSLSATPVCKYGDETVSSKSSGDNRSGAGVLHDKSRLHHFPDVNAGVTLRKAQQTRPENDNLVKINVEKAPDEVLQPLPASQKIADSSKINAEKAPEEVQQPLPADRKIAEASNKQVTESRQAPILEQDSASDVSFFRKVWQRWFGDSNGNSEVKSHDLEKHCDSEGTSEKKNNNTLKKFAGFGSDREGIKEEFEEKSSEVSYPVNISSSSNDSSVGNKASAEADENHFRKRSGLFNRIARLFKFWRSSPDSGASSDQSCEKHNQINSDSLKHEAFTQGCFWKEMEILLNSPRGSFLVTQSRTREEMAENLLKEGPLVLRSLSNTDLLQLVDLLITDKKWIEECLSETLPFRTTRTVEKSPALGHSNAANGLRSIFMPAESKENLQPKREGEKNLQEISQSSISSTIINKKSSDRTRCEILADCQKLVKVLLREHPDGYNMGLFKVQFLERYGYPLDVQGLGYDKLAYLLEIMPGIKIESNYVLPSSMVPENLSLETAAPNIQENSSHALGNTTCELPDASTKSDDIDSTWDDIDSTWDELGPVSSTSSKRKQLQSVVFWSKRREGSKRAYYPDYEPSLSDDEISDSEGEISTSGQLEQQQKPRIGEEDSSLLQILDSWYSSKESEDGKYNSENSEGMVDCSEYHAKPSFVTEVGIETETSLEDSGKRKRPQKYCFVADPVKRDKDKLISGIIGNLKKSSESRMEA